MGDDIKQNGANIREQRAKERAERGEGDELLGQPSGSHPDPEIEDILAPRRYLTEDRLEFFHTRDLPNHTFRKPMIRRNLLAVLGERFNIYLMIILNISCFI